MQERPAGAEELHLNIPDIRPKLLVASHPHILRNIKGPIALCAA
jgi:hypothetical protein